VAAGTARRVRAAVERLGYRPSAPAPLLRRRESGLVGVTIPSLTRSVHRGMMAGVEEVLAPAGDELLVGHLGSGSRAAASFLHSVEHQSCHGSVTVPVEFPARELPR
jgi:DNA-binding LacI/PurR family transcriptional regulator